MLRAPLILSLAACTATPGADDIVGPFTGTTHRYVIDRFVLPANNAETRQLADDLDGDQIADNQIGSVISTLAGQGNITPHGDAMIVSGAIASSIEIQADDLRTDDAAGVWYFGAEGAAATPVGGEFVGGVFASNRTRTTQVGGKALLRLPVFVDADPTEVELVGMQIDLTPDGQGGFDALIRGGIRYRDAITAAHLGIVQLLEARPQDHRAFWSVVDRDRNGEVTRGELESDGGLIAALLEPDIAITVDGEQIPALSLAFKVHLSPCAAGRCAPATTVDRCFDRVINGDESDIDCGGSCGDCPAAGMCRTGADCQTGGCDGGLCRAPTCGDQIRNSFESDVDCGGDCSGCATFGQCDFDTDCASGSCAANGVCY